MRQQTRSSMRSAVGFGGSVRLHDKLPVQVEFREAAQNNLITGMSSADELSKLTVCFLSSRCPSRGLTALHRPRTCRRC
jgi:hypothetical protein